MVNENHYHTLDVDPKATQGEIKQAYRRLVKRFHPDSQEETADHDKIVNVNAAYEILGDPQRRRVYDQELRVGDNYSNCYSRQQRTKKAQECYQRHRQGEKDREFYLYQWYQQIYLKIDRLISQILNPLDREIDRLSADPFDDELMEIFQEYIETCRAYFQHAKQIFSSQPNPPKLAKVAVNLYYCLNQISDGIDELESFTLNYDDHHLHTGKELFRIAYQLKREAQQMARTCLGSKL